SDRASALGAVNTVLIQDGQAIGHNTDWCGFQRPLLRQLPDAVGARVVQIGAGGAGSAVAYALLDLGVKHLTLIDAVPGKADELVARMSQLYSPDRVAVGTDLESVIEDVDGIVHCTPTGMATHPGTAVPEELLTPRRWVSEIVYFPLE